MSIQSKLVLYLLVLFYPVIAVSQYSETYSCSGGLLGVVLDYDQQTCTSQCNGNYQINVTTGVGPYTFSVTGPSYTSTLNVDSNLCPGNYSVTVTDIGQGINCVHSFEVFELSPIEYSVSVTNTSLEGVCDGSAEITLTGGVPPYYFQWYDSDTIPIPGETANIFDSLCAGTYFVQYWDHTPPCGWGTGGCGTAGSGLNVVAVTVMDPLEISVTAYPETCPGNCDGAIQIIVSGGTGNYSFNFPVYQSDMGSYTYASVFNLCGGPYTIVVTDDAGGYASETVEIYMWWPGSSLSLLQHESCAGACDGMVSFNSYYGATPDSYSRNGGITWQSSNTFTGLCPGTYSFICRCTYINPACIFPLGSYQIHSGDNNSSSTNIVAACDSYTWLNGQTYTANNSTATYTINNAAGCDSVITLNLTINHSSDIDTFATACDNFTWYGNNYTASGNYTKSFINSHGCDSTKTLHLEINSNAGVEMVSACDSYTWIDGITYFDSNNIATYTLTNVAGCDSVVTLNLTMNHSSPGNISVTACDNFEWYGNVYSTSGTYFKNLNTVNGCDSLVTLNLVINNSYNSDTLAIACDTFIWYGTTYTLSGMPTYGYNTENGCDSIITLNLSIENSNYLGEDVWACETFTWIDGITYTQDTTVSLYYTNSVGCDSVHTMHLDILQNSQTGMSATACDYFEWFGSDYTSSGTYFHTLTAENGCDSLLTLNLTIVNSSNTDTTATACDLFTWYGTTYSMSGMPTHIYTAENGCDSIITLNLSVFHSSNVGDYVWACDTFTWINGATYYQDTSVSLYLTSVNGCDSVYSLYLDILHSSIIDTTATSCDSFEWNGNTYFTSGSYPQSFINEEGCNSIITLDLTVNNINTNILVGENELTAETAFAQYQWLSCDDNFSIIPYQTEQSINIDSSGNYAVEITENGCVDTSSCVYVIGVGTPELIQKNNITVFPNPTKGVFYIITDHICEDVIINIYSVDHKLVQTENHKHKQQIPVELIGNIGLYFVEIMTDGEKTIFKILKQ